MTRTNKQVPSLASQRLTEASKAEKKAFEGSNITPTKNSGRTNKNGDAEIDELGGITFDHKQQSKAKDFKVKIDELNKVLADAYRSGHAYGALVCTNSFGRKIFVMEWDQAKNLLGLNDE